MYAVILIQTMYCSFQCLLGAVHRQRVHFHFRFYGGEPLFNTLFISQVIFPFTDPDYRFGMIPL